MKELAIGVLALFAATAGFSQTNNAAAPQRISAPRFSLK